ELPGIVERFSGTDRIRPEDKKLVSLLMSLFWMRGPAMRQSINRTHEQMAKQTMALLFDRPDTNPIFDRFERDTGNRLSPETREELGRVFREGSYALDPNNHQHLMMLDSIQNFANLFNAQRWCIHVSRTDKFITSDNPVVVTQPPPRGFYGYSFLERTHYFPLAPHILIEGSYPKENGKSIKRKTLFSGDRQRVLALNLQTAAHAHRYALAGNRGDLERVREVAERIGKYQQSGGGQAVSNAGKSQ